METLRAATEPGWALLPSIMNAPSPGEGRTRPGLSSGRFVLRSRASDLPR